MASVGIRSQRMDSLIAMTVGCISSSEVVSTIVKTIAMVPIDWIFKSDPAPDY